jgi:uncharacterized protein (DUF362 family)
MKNGTTRNRFIAAVAIVGGIWLVAESHGPALHADDNGQSGLVSVGFTARAAEPTDDEVRVMVDEVIEQVLGPRGLAAIISPGDKVVIKFNNAAPSMGKMGEQGRGMITDPRVIRFVAERAREATGFDGTAEVVVAESCYYREANPSITTYSAEYGASMYWTRLERTGDATVDPEDFALDHDADGILDGASRARLVNTDAIGEEGRFRTTLHTPLMGAVDIYLPKMLRTRQEAEAAGEPDQYCDVHIGLPVLKNHFYTGMTGAVKLHYGYRYRWQFANETGRHTHNGLRYDRQAKRLRYRHFLHEYICAQHRVRSYDFVIMDCLTGNRRGAQTTGGPFDPVDFILTNALLASTDSIAIDTVATLFAGFDPRSIYFLRQGRLDGLGTDRPGEIRLSGLDRFGEYRNLIAERYRPEGRYPFDERGGARIMHDFSPPTLLGVSEPRLLDGDVYSFEYQAEDAGKGATGLARVELLIDGELAGFEIADVDPTGEIIVSLTGLPPGSHSYRVALWDRALNCALSEERPLEVEPRPILISRQSEPAKVAEGEWTSLWVTVSGAAPISYQWSKDGVEIPGATTATYVISSARKRDEGSYTCAVSNPTGRAESVPTRLSVSAADAG